MAVPAADQTLYWEFVTSVNASRFSGYSAVVPTASDSTGTLNLRTTFMVEAFDSMDGLYWDSAPDSGYSVDNLPPSAVTPFTGTYNAGSVTLHWGVSTAPDFADYLVYRGSTPSFTPGPGNLVTTQADTGYVDHTPLQYYQLAAEDVHGNIGPYTLLMLPVALSVTPPSGYEFGLEGVHPNPSAGRTLSVYFTLPSAEHATLEVMDVAGRRVLSREVGSLGAGPHAVDLARDRVLPAGVYLVRLTQGERAHTARAAVVN